MVARWKLNKYVLISLKFYGKAQDFTSDNELITEYVGDDTQSPQKYGNMSGNT